MFDWNDYASVAYEDLNALLFGPKEPGESERLSLLKDARNNLNFAIEKIEKEQEE